MEGCLMYKKRTEKEKRDVVKNNTNKERVESQKKYFKINRTLSAPVNKCDNCRARSYLYFANNGKAYCKVCSEYFIQAGIAEWNGEK
jgi:hypothetical protein